MTRRLAPDEAQLWARVAATVRPLPGRAMPKAPAISAARAAAKPPAVAAMPSPVPKPRPARIGVAVATLDGSWDRRLGSGAVTPERTVDLHDHSLAAAHAVMEDAVDRAAADGIRLLLVITGKGRGGRPGVIRAQLADWLDASPQRRRIAALRPSHPRHGGGGAFYLVLRRA